MADSHISAAAIVALYLRSIDEGIGAISNLLSHPLSTLFPSKTTLDTIVPLIAYVDTFRLIDLISQVFVVLVGLAGAWLLSRWVYGVGPLRALNRYRTPRRSHA